MLFRSPCPGLSRPLCTEKLLSTLIFSLWTVLCIAGPGHVKQDETPVMWRYVWLEQVQQCAGTAQIINYDDRSKVSVPFTELVHSFGGSAQLAANLLTSMVVSKLPQNARIVILDTRETEEDYEYDYSLRIDANVLQESDSTEPTDEDQTKISPCCSAELKMKLTLQVLWAELETTSAQYEVACGPYVDLCISRYPTYVEWTCQAANKIRLSKLQEDETIATSLTAHNAEDNSEQVCEAHCMLLIERGLLPAGGPFSASPV
ncbi:uncharacterized protein L969DRAFT_97452 [Mixia osmundae IAM 14324]|uniref:Uncharacterized protein n=1 Tax=Mixia osmundae (strain CBS 9802 / IAM 14324 / JCM 22182 / KY 12970) TaxID=764103 RepID=G7E4H4_MIXOS|nr:uncharacterized protein L969DRAFT_97452 [Mixia osmundae IAM 14324]KEI36250.1 hypothetical protein L969DRAFT_97452 [Mixia osmundae IAM 14324]GAA97734.1 hypothetical protein E5Q_04413 [Mixia osmundae IAM 14324]